MADRRAAAFQLRPSNIRVAPLDPPGVDPGRDLVVYRVAKPPELLRRHFFVALRPDQPALAPAPPRSAAAAFSSPCAPTSTTSSPTSTAPSASKTQASIVTRPRRGLLLPR